MIAIVRCNNGIVTNQYLELIGEALSSFDNEICFVSSVEQVYDLPKTTTVVVARIIDAISVWRHGYHKLIMWFQGIEPEESFMTHRSKIRWLVLSVFEKFILKRALFSFFVSEEMRLHYQRKYKMKFVDNYYCMPCLNTEIHKNAFIDKDKYKNNYFTYVGSMAVWQKFEDTVACYKKIEELELPNTKLFVFTGEAEKAKSILENANIKNYAIDFVENSQMEVALSKIKYGFIIREDTMVNRVATPTKISTYLSCGLIPIYSECLCDFDSVAKHMQYVIKDDQDLYNKLASGKFEAIDNGSILNEYEYIFDTYYSRDNHIQSIRDKIRKLAII